MDGFTGAMHFERVALPAAGGVSDQPARTMEALDVLESVALAVMHERAKERHRKETERHRKETTRAHQRRRKPRG